MNLKKYLTLTRAGIIESLQFRLATVVMVIGNLLYLIVMYFLWKAIYASAGTDTVNGMTFPDTLIYLVLATALFNFMEMYTVWEIGRSIQSGKIVLDLLEHPCDLLPVTLDISSHSVKLFKFTVCHVSPSYWLILPNVRKCLCQ